MDIQVLLNGLLIGFAVAAPVGPIGTLCIQRSLAYGGKSGFATGLGAATADAGYAAVAAFGITIASGFLLAGQKYIRIIGVVFLLYLAIKTLFGARSPQDIALQYRSVAADYVSTVALTFANPATILCFAALFASAVPPASAASASTASIFIIGVFLGSASWWLILSSGVGLLRARVGTRFVRATNLVSGVILLAFAGYALDVLYPSK